MKKSKLERHLAVQAINHIDDPDGIDYFLRYFRFIEREDRLNAKDHDASLYSLMKDLYNDEFGLTKE